MVEFALNNCKLLPTNMEADIESILLLDASSISDLPARTGRLLDNLDVAISDGDDTRARIARVGLNRKPENSSRRTRSLQNGNPLTLTDCCPVAG